MTWPKFSDDFADDCWTLSDSAFRVHVEGLCWSARKLLDCRIAKADLPRFARGGAAGVVELLDCGFWADAGEHWLIVHHACYQPTRGAVLERQETNRNNGRRGGRPRSKAKSEAVSTTVPRELADTLKTQSVSNSLSDSTTDVATHRDRTGKDRTVLKGSTQKDEAEVARNTCQQCGKEKFTLIAEVCRDCRFASKGQAA